MRMTDRDHRPECHVIPFHRPQAQTDEIATTSIAAVIAVTVLHSSTESPEERLLDILERSGEVEVLDADDALGQYEASFGETALVPVNDNAQFTVL